MTRGEAKMIVEQRCGDQVFASRFVEVSEALGMLKLDEPKNDLSDKLSMLQRCLGWKTVDMQELQEELDNCGFEIVQKDRPTKEIDVEIQS